MTSCTTASYVALVLVSLSAGYWAGSGPLSASGGSGPTDLAPKCPLKGKEAENEAGRNSDPLCHQRDGEPLASSQTVTEDCKLVLVVRSDLGMSIGKIAAQCSHATLACYQTLSRSNPSLLRQWERTGQTKIALRCGNEDELLLLQAQAQSLNLCARSIQDAGRTQIAAGSRTVLGIGPGPARLINQVTGKLRLL